MSPVGSALGVGWRAELDGAVYGQPLVIGNQVIAATENDTVYALSARDGQVVWSVSLGQPMPGADLLCGDIDPLGITGTPAYDPDTGLVLWSPKPLTRGTRWRVSTWRAGRWCCAARSRLGKVRRSRTSNARR
jgi:PQQ-like domain